MLANPLAFDFSEHNIRFYVFGSGWQAWSTKDIYSIRTNKTKSKINASYQGVNLEETAIRTNIILHFSDCRQLNIPERRCWQFGYAPEVLSHLLINLYGELDFGKTTKT
jgi:hypothetical protein